MPDDVLLNKIAMIEHCLMRIREEYHGHEAEFTINFTKQDSVILNLLRACEAAIDVAMHLNRYVVSVFHRIAGTLFLVGKRESAVTRSFPASASNGGISQYRRTRLPEAESGHHPVYPVTSLARFRRILSCVA